MNFDWVRLAEGKRTVRGELASRPIAEKLRLLDAMRQRELRIRGDGDRTLPQALPAGAGPASGADLPE